ncbi:MAG: NUDIX hydrolase [Bacteroidia bacterium]
MTGNPWTTLASEIKYDNPWIRVTEHQVIHPNGQPGIYGVVGFKGRAVGVVPYEDGHIWMVGQYRYPLEQYSWEIPEGGSSPDEDTADTARRELREETGLTAGSLVSLFEMHLSNSATDEWAIVYLARDLVQGESAPEASEALHVRRMSLDEVYAEVEARRITDSMTVAAVYKLMLMRARGEL